MNEAFSISVTATPLVISLMEGQCEGRLLTKIHKK
jgi:hypothetical protein